LSSSAPEARAGCVKIEGTVNIIHAAGVPAVPTEGSYLSDGKVAMRWRRWRKYWGLTGRLRTSSITGEKYATERMMARGGASAGRARRRVAGAAVGRGGVGNFTPT
jgi:hypothetical protein